YPHRAAPGKKDPIRSSSERPELAYRRRLRPNIPRRAVRRTTLGAPLALSDAGPRGGLRRRPPPFAPPTPDPQAAPGPRGSTDRSDADPSELQGECTRSRADGDSRSAANKVQQHESPSTRQRAGGNPGGRVGVVGRMSLA